LLPPSTPSLSPLFFDGRGGRAIGSPSNPFPLLTPHSGPAALYREGCLLSLTETPPGYLDLLLEVDAIPALARPGQFVMLRAWPGDDPFLARPFDIAQADPARSTLRMLIKVAGKGTALLRKLQAGAPLYLAGPMGQPITGLEGSSLALLARGVGVAAVTFLAAEASKQGIPVYSFLSASSMNRLVGRELLQGVSTRLEVATDDGSAGYRGSALDLIEGLLATTKIDRLYTCGARRFARYTRELDLAGKLQGYLFLEGLMACGLGDCHGCAVKRTQGEGYFLVCRDGPVFRAGEVALE
jgi:dihydroorotate dehydrogenase electron transfer subunit